MSPPRILRFLAVTLGFSAASAAVTAGATVITPSASISWSAPQECPSEAVVAAEIERFLGQSLDVSRVQRLDVRANAAADGAGYSAQLVITTQQSRVERQLTHQSCAKLAEAAAFLIALAIDPERVQGQDAFRDAAPQAALAWGAASGPVPTGEVSVTAAPPCPAAPPSSPPCACPPPPACPLPCAFPPPGPPPPQVVAVERPLAWSAGIEGLVGGGALPELGPGIGVQAAWAPVPWARIAGQARWWAPQRRLVSGYETTEIRLELAGGGLSLCGLPLRGRVELRGCAALLGGAMSGVGVNVRDGVPRRARWSAVAAQARLTYWVSPQWGYALGVEGGPALDRPRFGVSGADTDPLEVHRAGPWVANVHFGLQFGTRADLLK